MSRTYRINKGVLLRILAIELAVLCSDDILILRTWLHKLEEAREVDAYDGTQISACLRHTLFNLLQCTDLLADIIIVVQHRTYQICFLETDRYGRA